MKIPNRSPDFIGKDGWLYFFDEMLIKDNYNQFMRLKYEKNVFYWFSYKLWVEDSNNIELNIAYKKWFSKKFLED